MTVTVARSKQDKLICRFQSPSKIGADWAHEYYFSPIDYDYPPYYPWTTAAAAAILFIFPRSFRPSNLLEENMHRSPLR
jgi:hypothetical protein